MNVYDPESCESDEDESAPVSQEQCGEKKANFSERLSASIDTLNDAGSASLPESGIFERDISQHATIQFEKDVWEKLWNSKVKKGKEWRFAKGIWEWEVAQAIKKANPFCSIVFKRHRLSGGFSRKARSNILFKGTAYCQSSLCSAKRIKIIINNNLNMKIDFGCCNIKHLVHEKIARPISGDRRTKEIKELKNTKKSGSVLYEERIRQIDDNVFTSGNRDAASSPAVLNQLLYEKRIIERLDKYELDSLLKLKAKFIADDKSKNSKVKGFIQHISIDPFVIMLWTRGGVKLFHDLCKNDCIFWDATGSVVNTTLTEKKLYYYELTLRNPSTGKTSVPVSGMISDSHSGPTVTNWLHTFRNHEKMIYGCDRISRPYQINSDRAMVFIISSLLIFNCENLLMFLNRAWRIVNGEAAPDDLQLTIIHACAFHFMRSAKLLVQSTYGVKQRSIPMWMLSLLMNQATMKDLSIAVRLVIRITCSKFLNDLVNTSIRQMNKLIKDFKVSLNEDIVEKINADKVDNFDEKIKCGTEEEMENQSKESPFKLYFKKMYIEEKANLAAIGDEGNKNSLYSEKFFEKLLNNLLPTIPVWSCLLLGDLSRHDLKTSASYSQYKEKRMKNPPRQHTTGDNFDNRTTGVSEQRMGVLYNCVLGGTRSPRMDDFVLTLNETFLGRQRVFVDSITSAAAPSTARRTKVITEDWNKKRSRGNSTKTYQHGSGKNETIKNAPTNVSEDEETKEVGKKKKRVRFEKLTNNTDSAKPLPIEWRDLLIMGWGGNVVKDNKSTFMSNTCTIDNFLWTIKCYYSCYPEDLELFKYSNHQIYQLFDTVISHLLHSRYEEAKLNFLQNFATNVEIKTSGDKQVIDAFGVDVNVITLPFYDTTKRIGEFYCDNSFCPGFTENTLSSTLLQDPQTENELPSAIAVWVSGGLQNCNGYYPKKPTNGIPYLQMDDDKFKCTGNIIVDNIQFKDDPIFIQFCLSEDLSDKIHSPSQVPLECTLYGHNYRLGGITVYLGEPEKHYVGYIYHHQDSEFYLYDGLCQEMVKIVKKDYFIGKVSILIYFRQSKLQTPKRSLRDRSKNRKNYCLDTPPTQEDHDIAAAILLSQFEKDEHSNTKDVDSDDEIKSFHDFKKHSLKYATTDDITDITDRTDITDITYDAENFFKDHKDIVTKLLEEENTERFIFFKKTKSSKLIKSLFKNAEHLIASYFKPIIYNNICNIVLKLFSYNEEKDDDLFKPNFTYLYKFNLSYKQLNEREFYRYLVIPEFLTQWLQQKHDTTRVQAQKMMYNGMSFSEFSSSF